MIEVVQKMIVDGWDAASAIILLILAILAIRWALFGSIVEALDKIAAELKRANNKEDEQ